MPTSLTIGFGFWIGSFQPSAALPPSAPVNTLPPSITPGVGTPGTLLATTTGNWSGNPGPSYTFEWLRNGVPIAGATSQTYTLQVADVGQAIKSRVTATNASGSANAQSANTVTPTAGTPFLALEMSSGLYLQEAGGFKLKLEANTI